MSNWKLCTSGAITRKCGVYANSSLMASGAVLAEAYDLAEGIVIASTRKDWSSYYSDVASGAKMMIADVVSDIAASNIIAMDLSAYSRILEAQTILDFMDNKVNRNMAILRDFGKANEIKSP